MIRLLCTCVLVGLLAPNKTVAQEKDSVSIEVTPYASFRGNLAVYDKEMDLQDNVTRVGLNGRIKKGKVSFLAATELHLNLFQGVSTFNIDGSPNSNFLDVQTLSDPQTLTNRLGYIGFDFEKYGTLTFGKQWSVYYDVASYTNQFSVFGGRASAIYVGGSDGGDNGTGRANQAVIYRNKFGPFSLGAQAQVRGGNNKKFIDGYGFSGQLEITKEIEIGGAVNRAFLSDHLIKEGKIIGLKGQPTYYAAGVNYNGKKFIVSAVGVIEKNGDFAQGSYVDINNDIVNPTVVFDAKGFEFYSQYNINAFSIHAGYNLYVPDTKSIETENNQSLLNKNYKINDIIFGIDYTPFQFAKIYAEQRISSGKTANGSRQFSVFALGMTLDITKTFKTKARIK